MPQFGELYFVVAGFAYHGVKLAEKVANPKLLDTITMHF